ncbi:MAG: PAS domain S-box protein [Deltaproteobacteria bacterium]|nr:PAS domain S-box protein [Deltaproteobacteria bacterium]
MADKPLYEELEQRVRQLDKEMAEIKRSEEGLRVSEEKWRSLVENAPSLILIVDRDGIIQYINHTVPGLEMEKVIGTNHCDYVPPQYHKVMRESIEHVFKTGRNTSYEIAGVGPNDSTSWYTAKVGPVEHDGEIVAVTIMPIDITERNQVEEELRESEKKYRRLVETMNDGLGIMDKKGMLAYINKRGRKMLGYSRDEMIGRPITDFVDDANRKTFEEQVAVRRKGEPGAYEIVWTGKDGRKLFTIVSAQAITDDEGRFEGSFGVFTDITERKQAEEALRDSEEKWRSLTENSVDYIMTLECDGTILFVNRTPPGVTREEVIGMSIFDHFPEKFKLVLRESINRVVETGEPDRHYVEYTSPEGITRHFEGRAAPITNSGRVAAITINATDITEQKLAEQVLREREASLDVQADELQEVNTALRVLLRQRDKDKTELEEKVFLNVRELVMPHVEKLKKSTMDAKQKGYLSVLESNLNEIISPFAHRLSSKYSTLTPTEIQMAFLIRDGKSTKEIAGLLNLSGRTVESHRQSIRVKMGIRNRKANLRSHLLSM